LARAHTLAATLGTPAGELGRPRADAAAALRLADLTHRLTAPTEAPALVVAAVTHAEIVATAPFASVNGVVARAAERLVLVSRGVDPTSVTVPEAGHARRADAYRRALARYAEGGTDGVRDWLLYSARAFVAAVAESPLRA
jgi:Fic family protein